MGDELKPLLKLASRTIVAALLFSNAAQFAQAATRPASAGGSPVVDRVLVEWVTKHAVPLKTIEPGGDASDLQAVTAVVGPSVRVIGLGESLHDQHELLTLRNRLFAYLVEHHGVTAYAGETPFTTATRVDDYVTNGGQLTPAVVHAVFAHSDDALEENLQLIEWIRSYNARPTTRRRVRFYGVDVGAQCWAPPSALSGHADSCRVAIDAALAYVSEVDQEAATAFRQRLAPLAGGFSLNGHEQLSAGQRDALTALLADVASRFVEKHLAWSKQTSELAYQRAYRSAVQARQLDANFRTIGRQRPPFTSKTRWDPRDSAMAENVLWALEREGPEARIFFFTHNSHLDKGAETPAGSRLREALGDQLVAIASLGPPSLVSATPTLANVLAAVKQPLFFLETKDMPLLDCRLERQPADWDNWMQRHMIPTWRVQDSFDGVVFVDDVGPAHVWSRK